MRKQICFAVLILAELHPGPLAWASMGSMAGSRSDGVFGGRLGIAAAFVGGGGGSRVPQSYLGIDIHDLSEDEVSTLKLKEAKGAEIVRVDHDGPAGQAGLREHDVVLMMNGQTVDGEEQLRRMLRETPSGRTVSLTILRDGQTQTVTATMANRSDVERMAWQRHISVPDPEPGLGVGPGGTAATESSPGPARGAEPTRGMGFFHGGGPAAMIPGHAERGLLAGASGTGAMLEALSPQLAAFFGAPGGAGLLVRSVAASSPAEEGGLKAGDVVVKVNQVPVVSGSDWTKLTRENKGRPVVVLVLRDKREQTITITPDGKRRSKLELPARGVDGLAGMSLFGESRRRWQQCGMANSDGGCGKAQLAAVLDSR